MSSRGATSIAKHRDRFESASMTNYAHAQHKCLLIIGKCGDMREIVGKVRDGIEVVGLAPNPSHTGYYVYVKRQGEKVVDFHIPCDGVARGFSWKDEEPFFEISSAQKFKYIEPGWIFLNIQTQHCFLASKDVRTWSAKLDQFSGPVESNKRTSHVARSDCRLQGSAAPQRPPAVWVCQLGSPAWTLPAAVSSFACPAFTF